MAELKEQKGSGKRNNHKMKPFHVYDYLMRETDEGFLRLDRAL